MSSNDKIFDVVGGISSERWYNEDETDMEEWEMVLWWFEIAKFDQVCRPSGVLFCSLVSYCYKVRFCDFDYPNYDHHAGMMNVDMNLLRVATWFAALKKAALSNMERFELAGLIESISSLMNLSKDCQGEQDKVCFEIWSIRH